MAGKGRKGKRNDQQSGKKIRVDLQKNRQARARQQNLTHDVLSDSETAEDAVTSERVTSRNDLSRKRTLVGVESAGDQVLRVVDESTCLVGRVISFIGLNCLVLGPDGQQYECTVRGVLRSLSRDSRNVVVAGDRVLFRQEGDAYQGVIERVEPRRGILSRGSHGREHILVANIDQVLIVASASDPDFKPQLVDRYLISAERHGIRPLICINKIDLIDPIILLEAVRTYGRLGYPVVLTSNRDGRGIPQLRSYLEGRQRRSVDKVVLESRHC